MNVNEPTLSIVIAAYNAEKVISRCLDSLDGDFEGELEIVVVDDGSSDTTASIVRRYATTNKSIRLINQENKGVDLARGLGIKSALGEYVLCVDADDFLLAGAIKKILEYIQTNSDIDAIWFQYCTDPTNPMSEDKGINTLTKVGLYEGPDLAQVRSKIFQGLSNSLWNKVLRKAALTDFGIMPRARYFGEDLSRLLLALPTIDSCLVSDDVLYCYVVTGDSCSKQYKSKYLSDINAVSDQLILVAQKDGAEGVCAAGNGILAQYYNLFVLAFNKHDKKLFKKIMIDAKNALIQANLPKEFIPYSWKLRLMYAFIMREKPAGIKWLVFSVESIRTLSAHVYGVANG